MPITIADVVQHLEAGGLEVRPPDPAEQSCSLVLPAHSYRNAAGEASVAVAVRVMDEGTYVEALVPRAYDAGEARHKLAFFDALLRMGLTYRHVRVGHDAADGEVRLAVDLPVLNGTVTPEQLQAMVVSLLLTLDDFHEVLVHAMQTGEVDPGRRLSLREPDVYGLADEDDGEGDGDDAADDGGDDGRGGRPRH